MAAPPPSNRSTPKQLQISLPRDTYDYLSLLASLGKLGSREKDIAVHLIIREVTKMQEAGTHNLKF
jgi:hypothetical protein